MPASHPPSCHSRPALNDLIADVETPGQYYRMSWLAEMVIQTFWEGLVEVGYRKWGWLGGIIAFVAPPAMIGLLVFVAISI